METNDSIGARIRGERERLGYSQAEFAAAMSVTRQSQSKYENDKRYPDALYLKCLTEIGGDVQYVLTGTRSAFDSTRQIKGDVTGKYKENTTGCTETNAETRIEPTGSIQEHGIEPDYQGGKEAVALTPEQEAWVKLFMSLPPEERDRLRAVGDSLVNAYDMMEKAKKA